MRYELTKLITSCNHHVEISHEYFETLKSKKEFLIEALFVEEKFNLVLENYSEFELELLGNSVRNMLFHDFEWSSGVNDIHSINRRIINLLTTCRLYMDQVCHNIHTIYGSGSAQAIAFKTQSSNEYDSVFGYRVMEAMRNYVQHRGLPIERDVNALLS
jgi:5-keto 4-deoxyuronate isomerase